MMKLIQVVILVVLFKNIPADSSEGSENKNNGEADVNSNQPGYIVAQPSSLGYVSDLNDLGTTGVVFQFRRSIKSDNTEIEARRRSALDKGFMRFGRAGGNMLRFGRSSVDSEPEGPKSEIPLRLRKNDKNLLRFGRAGFMRFGRNNVEESNSEDEYDEDENEINDFVDRPILRSSEQKGNMLRFGRSSSESLNNEYPTEPVSSSEKSEEKNGNKKSTDRNMLRFGRAGNIIRFGRGNMLRFGKRDNMLRFGRDPSGFDAFLDNRQTRAGKERNLLRLGRAGNLIRFGRNDKNVMRFGKRVPQGISSSTRIYCEENDCVVQEKENQITENDSDKKDHLQELFGKPQGYGEYLIQKK